MAEKTADKIKYRILRFLDVTGFTVFDPMVRLAFGEAPKKQLEAINKFFIVPIIFASSCVALWWVIAPQHKTKTMRAVRYSTHGSTDVLHLDTNAPRPSPLPGQVLIKVSHASLNPCDFKFRRNWMPNFLLPKPKIPGADIAGVVVDPGNSVKLRAGDRVSAMLPLLGTRWGGPGGSTGHYLEGHVRTPGPLPRRGRFL